MKDFILADKLGSPVWHFATAADGSITLCINQSGCKNVCVCVTVYCPNPARVYTHVVIVLCVLAVQIDFEQIMPVKTQCKIMQQHDRTSEWLRLWMFCLIFG